jgi:DNA-binding CsgD family transcriptional regulator
MTFFCATDAVIERIYDAVSDGNRWREAIVATSECVGADAMLLIYGNLAAGGPRVIESTGFKADVLSTYARNHLRDDELIKQSMAGPAGVIVSSGHRAPEGSFHDTTVYRRLLWPCELSHLVGAAVVNGPKVYASLWASRTEETGAFEARDLQPFSELVPHFGRAMTVYHRLRRAEMRADLANGAFDRVAVGVVLLDVGGAPILANREAERIAARQDGFVLRDTGIAAEQPGDSKRLRELLRGVGRYAVGRYASPTESTEFIGGGAVRITRSSGRADYHAVVIPLPRRCQPGDGSGAVAVLFITDPEKSPSPVDYLVGDLYGLTDAEVRLVCLLLQGRGLTDAAGQLGLSRNTVHSQLASVFQKTGTRRQGELLRLLLGGVAPVDVPDASSGFHQRTQAFEA